MYGALVSRVCSWPFVINWRTILPERTNQKRERDWLTHLHHHHSNVSKHLHQHQYQEQRTKDYFCYSLPPSYLPPPISLICSLSVLFVHLSLYKYRCQLRRFEPVHVKLITAAVYSIHFHFAEFWCAWHFPIQLSRFIVTPFAHVQFWKIILRFAHFYVSLSLYINCYVNLHTTIERRRQKPDYNLNLMLQTNDRTLVSFVTSKCLAENSVLTIDQSTMYCECACMNDQACAWAWAC